MRVDSLEEALGWASLLRCRIKERRDNMKERRRVMALFLRLSEIFLVGTKGKNNRQALLLLVIVDSRRVDAAWYTLGRGSTETWYRDRCMSWQGECSMSSLLGCQRRQWLTWQKYWHSCSPYLLAHSIGLWPTGQKCQQSLIIFFSIASCPILYLIFPKRNVHF